MRANGFFGDFHEPPEPAFLGLRLPSLFLALVKPPSRGSLEAMNKSQALHRTLCSQPLPKATAITARTGVDLVVWAVAMVVWDRAIRVGACLICIRPLVQGALLQCGRG